MTSARHHRLYHRLQVAARELQRTADVAIRPSGLSTAQLAVLAVVEADQPVRQGRVADQLSLTEQALTAMIRRLDSLDLVRRRPDPHDGRSTLLELTPSGTRTLHDAGARFDVVNEVLDGTFDADELATLAGLLDRIRQALAEDQPEG
ncbi:MAG: MarR family winged helix-turn-helix transcriptional regulator [Actinomycetota bacterium]